MNREKIKALLNQFPEDEVQRELDELNEKQQVMEHLISTGAKTLEDIDAELDVLIDKGVTTRNRADKIIRNLIEILMENGNRGEKN
jgi:hypothetical protein